MSNETDFLKKMQGVYDAQNSESQRQLNTLAFEYASTLQQLPALQQELNNALAATADLDVTQLLQRFQPVLQTASELLLECELLDDEQRNHPEMTKLLQRLTSHYTLATANTLTQKVQQLLERLQGNQSVNPILDAPQSPASPEQTLYEQALNLLKREAVADWTQAAVNLHQLAERNFAPALHQLYILYMNGTGVAKDAKKAFAYLRQAVDAGDASSMVNLSHWVRNNTVPEGVSLQRNFEQAKFLASRAIELNCVEGYHAMASLYQHSEYPERNPLIALGYYQQGAERDCPACWLEMGRLYQQGEGVAQDLLKAIDCFERSFQLDKDDQTAAVELAKLYEFGLGVPADPQKALIWFNQANPAAKKQICIELGYEYYYYASADNRTWQRESRPEQALYWWHEGAQRGSAVCCYFLGQHYQASKRDKNLNTAQDWYQQALAKQDWYLQALGYLEAYLGLGQICLEQGDTSQALHYFKLGAEQRDASALSALADFYSENGTQPDLAQELYWRKQYAELSGYDWEMRAIAEAYQKEGPTQNFAKALEWYHKANQHGGDYYSNIGRLYRNHLHDTAKAVEAWTQGAEQKECGICFDSLVDYWLAPETLNVEQAQKWLNRWLAKPEINSSDLKLLIIHWSKHDSPLRNLRKVIELTRRLLQLATAADYDKASASYELGKDLLEDGPEQNVKLAIEFLQQAAQFKHPFYSKYACNRLYSIYYVGDYGITADPEQAAYWLEQEKQCKG